MLHNFGGNLEMYGNLDVISSGPIDARVTKNSTMVCVLCVKIQPWYASNVTSTCSTCKPKLQDIFRYPRFSNIMIYLEE